MADFSEALGGIERAELAEVQAIVAEGFAIGDGGAGPDRNGHP